VLIQFGRIPDAWHLGGLADEYDDKDFYEVRHRPVSIFPIDQTHYGWTRSYFVRNDISPSYEYKANTTPRWNQIVSLDCCALEPNYFSMRFLQHPFFVCTIFVSGTLAGEKWCSCRTESAELVELTHHCCHQQRTDTNHVRYDATLKLCISRPLNIDRSEFDACCKGDTIDTLTAAVCWPYGMY